MGRKQKKDLLQGTLDLLVLRVLETGPRHGYAVARRIEQISEDALKVQQGSIYPSLHRLEDKALIESEWKVEDGKRPIKVYSISKDGIAYLEEETESWRVFSKAVNTVLKNA